MVMELSKRERDLLAELLYEKTKALLPNYPDYEELLDLLYKMRGTPEPID